MRHGVSRPLALGSVGLLVLLAAHDASHALDDGLDTKLGALALVGTPQWIVLAVLAAVILRGERDRAALAALLLGAGAALGFVAIHLLPFGPASYWDLSPSVASWLLAWVPPVVGLAVAARAWSEWRAAMRARGAPGTPARLASRA